MSTNKVALLSLSLTLFFVTELRYFGIINIWTNIFILPKNARSVDSSIKSFAWSYCNFRGDSKSVKFSIYCKTKLAQFVVKYFEKENRFDDFDYISQFWPELVILTGIDNLTRSTRLCWVRRVRHFCAPPCCFAWPHGHCGEVGNRIDIQFPVLLFHTIQPTIYRVSPKKWL